MANVIRSARISGDAVTLAILSKPDSRPAQADAMRKAPAGIEQVSRAQNGIGHASSEAAQAEWAQEQIMSALREKEAALEERERMLHAQLAVDREQAHRKAYAEGYKQGEAEGARQFDEQLDALRRVIRSLKQDFSDGVANLEDVIVGIAFEAVCKMIGNAMYDTDGVLAVVREAMSRVKDQERLVLRVSPQDYDLLRQHWDELFKEGQEDKHDLVADDRVALGGCLVETSGGTIDGRLEIQMQQLRDTLIVARRMLPE